MLMSTMNPEGSGTLTPEEVVRGELDAWSRLDVDEIVSFFGPDAVWDNVPIGAVTGHDEIRKAVVGWVSRMQSGNIEILNLAVAGSVVLTERIDHFVFDGHDHDARVMGAFEVYGGQIAAWRDYFDMGAGREVFGDKPYPA
jgi:limonene-1,2-epoxide hydrolase